MTKKINFRKKMKKFGKYFKEINQSLIKMFKRPIKSKDPIMRKIYKFEREYIGIMNPIRTIARELELEEMEAINSEPE
jgi:hypothetical protein